MSNCFVVRTRRFDSETAASVFGLADFNRGAIAGLEAGMLQLLSGESDFRLDVAPPIIPGTFDLQTARAHFCSPP
jgi:hypothetical protein